MNDKSFTYTGIIDRLTRVNSSRNGNPRFRIHFTDGTTALTESDGALAYELENRENIGVPLTVYATPGGCVSHVQPMDSEETEK